MIFFNNKRAFTLVELIIVIAVIGVLAAILIPVFSNVIEKANAKSALSDAKNALQIAIAELTDGTGGITIGEGSVFKIRKADKDWYFTYYDNGLHEGTGAENANPLRPIPRPDGSVIYMAENCYYASERDSGTVIIDELPTSTIIYNTNSNTQYTPPEIPTEADKDTDGYFLIKDATQLTTAFFTENGWDSNYRLANNISLSGEREPINGTFTGKFDGNGKSISGLTINKPNDTHIGLFSTFNGEVNNLTLNVNRITARSYAGAFCGYSDDGTFTNIHVNITNVVEALAKGTSSNDRDGRAGGLCGMADNSNITLCSVNGKVHGVWIGGIASRFTGGTLSKSYFCGTLSAFDVDAPVLTGSTVNGIATVTLGGTIENCYAKFSVENTAERSMLSGIGNVASSNSKIKASFAICTGITGYDSPYSVIGGISAQAGSVISSYTLSDSPLAVQEDFDGNGRIVDSLTQANCSGLSTDIWSFAGEYPTLINNPE